MKLMNSIKQILVSLLTQILFPKSKKITLEELSVDGSVVFLHKDRSVSYSSRNYRIIPDNKKNDFFWLPMYQQKQKINDAFYSTLSNCFLTYPHGVLFNAEKSVIMTSVRNRQDYLVKSGAFKFKLKNQFEELKIVNGYALSALDLLGGNYYHFLIDIVSYFDCYWHFRQNNSVSPKVVLAKNAPDFQSQWLRILGVLEEDLIIADQNLKIENLIVASSRITSISLKEKNKFTYLLDPDSIFWLREFVFTKFSTVSKTKKIFISREKVTTRRIFEENKLIENLSELGFEKVVLEDLTVLEQIDVFRSATHVISTHGAALTNMIFADHCHLIELFPSTRYRDSASIYYQITEMLCCRHDLVLCDEVDGNETLSPNFKVIKRLMENGKS